MQIGRVKVEAKRWPWQEDRRTGKPYGWGGDGGWDRFGGGWRWKLGIDIGGSSLLLNLLYGMVVISWFKPSGGK